MQIKQGGYYRRRDGNVVGPAYKNESISFPWRVNGYIYTDQGAYDNESSHKSSFDLIAEVEVRDKLPFELKAGGKYVLDNGETVTLRGAGFSPSVNVYVPLVAIGLKYGYVSCFGEVADEDGTFVARIVSEYHEPPPTSVARLKQAIDNLAAHDVTATVSLIRGVIAELEK